MNNIWLFLKLFPSVCFTHFGSLWLGNWYAEFYEIFTFVRSWYKLVLNILCHISSIKCHCYPVFFTICLIAVSIWWNFTKPTMQCKMLTLEKKKCAHSILPLITQQDYYVILFAMYVRDVLKCLLGKNRPKFAVVIGKILNYRR